MLICIEGIDFSGKTTFTAQLTEALRKRGFAVENCSNHYDQPNAEAWRTLYLDKENELTLEEQILLSAFGHSRGSRVSLKPKLEEGNIVVMDRYLGSYLAMQGMSGGAEYLEKARSVLEILDLPEPDLYIALTLSQEEFERRRSECTRARGREPDVLESKPWDTYQKVVQDFYVTAGSIIGSKTVVSFNHDEPLESSVNSALETAINYMVLAAEGK